jgi:CheY-like chemotaxis protein
VSDTGKGIPTEFLRHVFDRFRQADSTTTRAHGGLGLGLSIVRHLVEMHGGIVMAESPGEGLGSTFFVTLPLTPAARQAHGAEGREQRARARRQTAFGLSGLRVLVVDDEDDTRRVISAVMSQHGAEVMACGSAREALDTLRRWRPDILMSDIGMPGEDGYALIRQVRALPADCGGRTPAAALTAYAREEDRKRALAAGYQLHVAKPFSAHELIAAVSNLHSFQV